MLNNKELEQYYQDLFDLFSHPGWQHFLDYYSGIAKSIEENGWNPAPVEGMTKGEQLVYNSGVLNNTRSVLSFRASHELAYEIALQEQEIQTEDE